MSINRTPSGEMRRTELAITRRRMLLEGGGGLGAIALAHLLGDRLLAGAPTGAIEHTSPLVQKLPHHHTRARSVIFLFMEGGPSHIDLFDPKPRLNELAGQPLPASFNRLITAGGVTESPLLGSQRKWNQHGQSGIWVSDWYPNIATCVDDIAVIRSCWTNGLNHSGGVCQMNTGIPVAGRPSLGSWVTYGLGTENESLPAYVVIEDDQGKVINGPRNWGSGFMPAVYQGIPLQGGQQPIRDLNTPESVGDIRQRRKLALLGELNRQHVQLRGDHSELEARIASYELAFRMQAEAPEAVDLSGETAETLELYGINDSPTEDFGRNCLLARRLVERGVRFVQLYHGAGKKWDAHADLEKNHSEQCRSSDRPIAGLLKDLKCRGLLDETLVVWGGEFGRTPMSEGGAGRDHNPTGFTMWMAGGGVKGGQTIGATDEVGLHAVEDRLHVHDLHATILHLLGINHRKLVYLHKGQPERVDLNSGHAYKRITTG